jgi:hypothetical protein
MGGISLPKEVFKEEVLVDILLFPKKYLLLLIFLEEAERLALVHSI